MDTLLVNFCRTVLTNAQIPANIYPFPVQFGEGLDNGLRKFLSQYGFLDEQDPFKISADIKAACERYRFIAYTDRYCCEYILLSIPDPKSSVLIIGPFSYTTFTTNQIHNLCQKLKLPEELWDFMIQYYLSIPVTTRRDGIFLLISALAETLYGNNTFNTPYRFPKETEAPSFSSANPFPSNEQFLPSSRSLQYAEDSCAAEDMLVKCICTGNIEMLVKYQPEFLSSPAVRNASYSEKHRNAFLFSFETLCRQAAKIGGVHPLYLYLQSSKFFDRIMSSFTQKDFELLVKEISRKYCQLVQNHSLQQYSSTVQKVLSYIDFHLTEDLSLNTLADHFSLNKNYLSSIFKKETGLTLTAYVNQARIKTSLYLLNTTSLSIQNIAQSSGFSDSNYFSRLFRNQIGISPQDYRNQLNSK